MKIILGLYEHYKGGKYEVLGLVRHSETHEELVLYKALYEKGFPLHSLLVRPVALFFDTIEVQGEIIPRFKKI
jgi:hypothetical protein